MPTKSTKTKVKTKAKSTTKPAKPAKSIKQKSPTPHLPQPNFTFNPAKLQKQLHLDAKGLGLHPGAADAFIDRVVTTVSRQVSAGKIITRHELNATIVRELKKYHRDFAYIFQNRDKIV